MEAHQLKTPVHSSITLLTFLASVVAVGYHYVLLGEPHIFMSYPYRLSIGLFVGAVVFLVGQMPLNDLYRKRFLASDERRTAEDETNLRLSTFLTVAAATLPRICVDSLWDDQLHLSSYIFLDAVIGYALHKFMTFVVIMDLQEFNSEHIPPEEVERHLKIVPLEEEK